MSFWSALGTVGHNIRYIDAGPISTRILEAGEGEPLSSCYARSSGGHLEAYARNAGALGAHFRVVALDMIGHGYSGSRPDNATTSDRRHYGRTCSTRSTRSASSVFYISRASRWAVGSGAAFAARCPERVSRLVINTPAGLTCNEPALERQRALFLKAVDEPSRENIRARLEWLMADPAMVTEDLVEARYAIYTQPGYAQTMRQRSAILMEPAGRRANMLHDEDLRKIGVPTLVLWTAHNPTDGVEVGRHAAATIPDARLEVMEGCGHWPQFEDPPRFNALLTEFLSA